LKRCDLLGYLAEARIDLGDKLTKKTGKGIRPPGQLPQPNPRWRLFDHFWMMLRKNEAHFSLGKKCKTFSILLNRRGGFQL
jgi:hypothetical protein